MAPAPGCHLWSGSMCGEWMEADPPDLTESRWAETLNEEAAGLSQGQRQGISRREMCLSEFSTTKLLIFLFFPYCILYCTGYTRDEESCPISMKAEHLHRLSGLILYRRFYFFPYLVLQPCIFIVWTHRYLYVGDVPYDLVLWLRWLQPWSLGALGSCL